MNHCRFRQSPTVITRRIGGEICALVPPAQDLHSLSGSALVLWDLLEVPRALPDLVKIASSFYSLEPGQIASDIDPWVDDLISKGLVEEIEEADI